MGGLGINWYAFGCNREDIGYIHKGYRGPHLSFWGLYPNTARSQSTSQPLFSDFLTPSEFLFQWFSFPSPIPSLFSSFVRELLLRRPLQESQAREAGTGFSLALCFVCPWRCVGHDRYLESEWWREYRLYFVLY